MNTCKVTCSQNGNQQEADILSQSAKFLKVALKGTTITISMSRKDATQPYVGNVAGLEFSSNG